MATISDFKCNVKRHFLLQHSKKTHECHVCRKFYGTELALKAHAKRSHGAWNTTATPYSQTPVQTSAKSATVKKLPAPVEQKKENLMKLDCELDDPDPGYGTGDEETEARNHVVVHRQTICSSQQCFTKPTVEEKKEENEKPTGIFAFDGDEGVKEIQLEPRFEENENRIRLFLRPKKGEEFSNKVPGGFEFYSPDETSEHAKSSAPDKIVTTELNTAKRILELTSQFIDIVQDFVCALNSATTPATVLRLKPIREKNHM